MTPLQLGQRVKYHGSLPQFHGEGVVKRIFLDRGPTSSLDGHRYDIALDSGRLLTNTRRQNLTAVVTA